MKYNLSPLKKRDPYLCFLFPIITYFSFSFLIINFFFNPTFFEKVNGYVIFLIIGVIIYLFLYPIFRLIKINRELSQIDPQITTPIYLKFSILFCTIFIGFIFFVFILFQISKSLNRISDGQIPLPLSLFLLVALFPFGVGYIQYNINQLVDGNNENSKDDNDNNENKISKNSSFNKLNHNLN